MQWQDKIGKYEVEQGFNEYLLPVIKQHPDIFDEKVHNLELFHRAGSTIMANAFTDEKARIGDGSRNSNMDGIGDKSDKNDSRNEEEQSQTIVTMVPMADMLNHKTGFNNARLFWGEESLQMIAVKNICAGEQVYNTYGDLCNADLLRKYGFVDEPNKHNIVEINGQLVADTILQNESMRNKKINFLLEEDILDDVFVVESNGELPPELIITIKVLLMDAVNFKALKKSCKLPKHELTAEVYSPLIQLIETQLAMYKTGLEDDEQILANPGSLKQEHGARWRNYMNSIIVRLGEKRILCHVLEFLKASADEVSQGRSKRQKVQ